MFIGLVVLLLNKPPKLAKLAHDTQHKGAALIISDLVGFIQCLTADVISIPKKTIYTTTNQTPNVLALSGGLKVS